MESLRCIPMQVRLKLDTCGVKLKLAHWHQFNQDDRQALIELPCETAADVQSYRQFLEQRLQERTGTAASMLTIDPAPAWLDSTIIPESVQAKAEASGVAIAIDQWAQLIPVERFALIKLSRSSHENANFLPALREFHLV